MAMEYRCGNCGSPLSTAALDSGVCPTCGAHISPFGDVIEAPPAVQPAMATDPGWPHAPLEPPSEALTGPIYTAGPLRDTQTRLEAVRTSRTTGRLADPAVGETKRISQPALLAAICLAAAVILLCTIVSTGALVSGLNNVTISSPHPTQVTGQRFTPIPTSANGLGFPTENPDPTSLPFNQATPTFEPTSTPFGGPPTPTPSPSPSPTALATGTPSDTPTTQSGASQISVTPPLATIACPGRTTFTVANTGSAPLSWTAQGSSSSVTVSPPGDTLPPGQTEPAIVTDRATKPGKMAQIQFTDNSGASPPVTVTVACG
jgi:hypothetical protein